MTQHFLACKKVSSHIPAHAYSHELHSASFGSRQTFQGYNEAHQSFQNSNIAPTSTCIALHMFELATTPLQCLQVPASSDNEL
jgi:hypothetical protein